MWHVRTRPRLLQMFALVWGTDDLLTSFEAFSLLPPREVRDARASKRPMRSSCVNRFFASAPGKRSRSRSPSPSPRKRRGAMMSP